LPLSEHEIDFENSLDALPVVEQLRRRLPNPGIWLNGRTERLLDELSITQESQPASDVQGVLSLPGAGRIVTGTLLAEASHLIAERDYHAPRAHAGAAPSHDKVETEPLC
jgi:hypothetical protein